MLLKGVYCVGEHFVDPQSIPFKLANVPKINFPKYSIALKVNKILNTVSHIPRSKMDSILYPWK